MTKTSLKNIVFTAILFLLLVMLFEGGVRLLVGISPKVQEKLNVISHLLGETPTKPVKYLPNAYRNYTKNTGWFAEDWSQPEERDPEAFVVITLGGSTTESFAYLDSLEDTWSEQLERKLEKELNRSVVVINGGVGSGTTFELVSSYLFHYRHFNPDLVILHTGVNDGQAILLDGYKNDYSHYRKTFVFPEIRRFEQSLLSMSYAYRLAFYVLSIHHKRFFESTHWLYAEDINDPTYTEKLLKNATEKEPTGFASNVDILIRNSLLDGAKVLLMPIVWSPTVLSGDQQLIGGTVSLDQRRAAWKARMVSDQKNRDVLKQLSNRHGVPIVPFEIGDIPAEYFLDHVHTNKDGESIKAQRAFDVIKSKLLR